MADETRDVTVYTTPFCVPCDQLKRFLESHGIAYITRDLMTVSYTHLTLPTKA